MHCNVSTTGQAVQGILISLGHEAPTSCCKHAGNYDFGYDIAAFGPVAESIQYQRNMVRLDRLD